VRTAALLLVVAVVSAAAASRTNVAQKQGLANFDVRIICDGAERRVRVAQTSVRATLKAAGIKLGPADKVSPDINTRITDGMEIRVVRVVRQTITEKLPIGFRTIRKPWFKGRPGLVQVVSEGRRGEKLVTWSARYEDGKEVGRKVIRSKILTPPKDRVILVGQQGALTSRGFIPSRRMLRMLATGYDPGPRSCGRSADGRTACGMRAGYGVVAVDPRIIEIGSRLYIEGYGFAIAGDTGSAIRGRRIDLGFDSYRDARRFGTRWVNVHVLK